VFGYVGVKSRNHRHIEHRHLFQYQIMGKTFACDIEPPFKLICGSNFLYDFHHFCFKRSRTWIHFI